VETLAVLADRGYDTDSIRNTLKDNGIKAVIPTRVLRKFQIPHDEELYKKRNRIERCFCRLKSWRRIATRFDRNDSHFMDFVYFSASLLSLC
jgi:transposase